MVSLFDMTLVALVGAFGSFVDTAAGMGFGALSTTVLVASGYAPAMVVVSVNLAKVPGGIAGGLAHWRLGNVRWNWVLPLAISGVLGGVAGAIYVTSFSPETLRRIVPWLLVGIGFLIVRRAVSEKFQIPPRVDGGSAVTAIGGAPTDLAPRRRHTPPVLRDASLYATGFVAGVFNSATGAYGPIATSGLILAKGGRPKIAVGTSTLVEVAVAAAVSVTLLVRIATSSAFDLSWQLPVALTLGAVVAAPVGAWVSSRLPARPLTFAVGVVLIAINVTAIGLATWP